jgi:hypothetical protein
VLGRPFIGSGRGGVVRRGGVGAPFYRVRRGRESGGRWWGAIIGHPVRWGGETEGVSGE